MKIVLCAALTLFLLGCSDDKTATNSVDTQSVVAEKTELLQSKVDEATKAAEVVVEEATKEAEATVVEAKNVAEETKVAAKEAAQEVSTAAAKTATAAKETTKSVVAEVKEAAVATKESAKEVVAETKETVAKASTAVEEKIVAVTAVSGADLYKACASCHGQNAEKPALGKSQIIKGWDAAKIASALHGYKDGTYGGAMKNLMKPQSMKLSDADIKAVAEYISKF